MKRTMNWAALGLAAGLLAACGGSGESEPQADAPTPPAESESATTPETPAETDAASEPSETAEAEPAANEFAGLPEPYASADYDRGRRIFYQCQSCHTLEEGGQAVLGPNLYGLFDREVGTKEGFDYSPALQEADFTWTPEQLEQWLANPREFLPGNRMSFAGVRRPDDRTAVIAYIMAETGYEPS
ncbi:c-type cytochrome [Henriciella aquimarina]|uniref:c-type cytochrome n=1 Tax=Henriciella aquimarina TaxID=545261 RepID=UPI001F311C3A|nr:cytochrome c family protein [Henriciella aquimarina]